MTGIMMTDIMTRREIIEGIELTLHFRQRNPSTLFLQQTTSQQADHLINNNSLLFKRTRDSFQHWIFIIDFLRQLHSSKLSETQEIDERTQKTH